MENITIAYLLIAVGLLLLTAQLFIPSGGVIFVLAIISLATGLVMIFYYDISIGLVTSLALLVVLPIAGGILLHYWPKTPMGKRLFLTEPEDDMTVASMPVNLELERLRGRCGRTLSDLRPSGVTDFDGWRVDTITEGFMVEAGQWVRCVDVKAGKVLVRPIDKPDLTNLEQIDLG